MKSQKRKIEKVMLLFPPVIFSRESPKQIMPPLGISYLGAFLESDYEIKLLDAAIEGYDTEQPEGRYSRRYGLEVKDIIRKISEFSPDVVGITCLYSSQFAVVSEICTAIKKLSKEIITVLGGAHPTFLTQQCIAANRGIDFIVLGEGERAFKNLLDNIKDGTSCESIDGIAFAQDGKVILNTRVPFIEDLDLIPFPARQMLPLDKYFKINLPMGLVSKHKKAMSIITSRGCPYQCCFCSSSVYWGRRYRVRSADNVLDEMQALKDMGIKELKFFDDNLTLDLKRAKKIFKGMIERNFNFSWNTPNGIAVQTLDEEMISLMKRSGCYEITLAIESGDERILRDVLKKPVNLKQTERTVRLIKDYGIDTYGFFIIGFPEETKAEIYNTLNYIEKIRLDRISLFIANPLPGTQIYEQCLKRGYLRNEEAPLALDYFKSVFETENFDRNFLESLRRQWYWMYNLKLISRNPFKFLKVYYKFIMTKPLFLLRTILNKLIIPGLES